jgi:hypothetical protein
VHDVARRLHRLSQLNAKYLSDAMNGIEDGMMELRIFKSSSTRQQG